MAVHVRSVVLVVVSSLAAPSFAGAGTESAIPSFTECTGMSAERSPAIAALVSSDVAGALEGARRAHCRAGALSDREVKEVRDDIARALESDRLSPTERQLLAAVGFEVETRGCGVLRSRRSDVAATEQPDAIVKAQRARVTGCLKAMEGEAAAFREALRRWRALAPSADSASDAEDTQARQTLLRKVSALPLPTLASARADLAQPVPYLRALHDVAYKNLKSWQRDLAPKADQSADADAARQAQRSLSRALHGSMEEEGLRVPISAEFRTGYVRGDANSAGGGSGDQGDNVQGYVAWSTQHFGSDTDRERAVMFDVSLGGRFGMQPALTLVEPAPQTTTGDDPGGEEGGDQEGDTQDETDAAEQQAFTWNAGVEAHLHLGDNVEIEGFGRGGTTTLFSTETLLQAGDVQTLVVPLTGSGKTEWFFEAGVSGRLHWQSRDRLHELNGLSQPALEVGFAWKQDNRFSQLDDGQVAFADGFSRRRFWLNLAGIPVKGVPAGQEGTTKMVTVSFGVEREWGGSVPAVTRFTIQGDVNLIKALRGR